MGLATSPPAGQSVGRAATAALNEASVGLPGLTPEQAAAVTVLLRDMRAAAGDIRAEADAPRGPEAPEIMKR